MESEVHRSSDHHSGGFLNSDDYVPLLVTSDGVPDGCVKVSTVNKRKGLKVELVLSKHEAQALCGSLTRCTENHTNSVTSIKEPVTVKNGYGWKETWGS